MFSPLFLSIISTTIIGGIVYIIFNLIFKEDEQGSNKLTSDETQEFVDNSLQEKDNHFVDTTNELKTEDRPQEAVSQEVTESDKPSEEAKDLIELSSDITPQRPDDEVSDNKESVETTGQQTDGSQQIDDLFDFEEINESNELFDERPVEQEVVEEVVNKTEAKTTLNEFKDESDLNLDKQEFENQFIENKAESEEPEDRDNRFWNLEDTQNLKHLNKSRPKKQKSRPSVKIVFTDDSTDPNCDQQREDPISQNARELVDTLFENLDSDVEEYKARTDFENSQKEEEVPEEDQTVYESKVCETIEKTIEKNDDSFEEIASGEYKKFDEFSDSFRTETRKQEISRKSYEISSVKSYEITVDSSQPINEEMLDNLLKNFDANDTKTQVFEENYNKVTESQTLKLRKGDKTEVFPILNNETISHTKSFGERSLSSSSLSKMSLEDLDMSLRSSKSRLSETIDTVTKPLLSSPTLFRRSLIESDDDKSPNESPNRTQFPLFGRSQSSLMKEMKDKEFRKSLKPFTDFKDIDKNAFNE